MFDSIRGRPPRRRLSHFGTSPALTVVELLCAIAILGVLAGGGTILHDAYSRSRRAATVAEILRWEVTVARSYAVRSGRPMTLIVDESTRSVSLRDGRFIQRTVSLGDGALMRVETLRLAIPGDSLVFSPRGVCLNCDTRGPTDVLIEAEGRTATVHVGTLGAPGVSVSVHSSGH